MSCVLLSTIISQLSTFLVQTDLTLAALRYLLRLNHHILKYPADYDPTLTSAFASPFVRSFLLRGTPPAPPPASSGGARHRAPRAQTALGRHRASRGSRSRASVSAPPQSLR